MDAEMNGLRLQSDHLSRRLLLSERIAAAKVRTPIFDRKTVPTAVPALFGDT
jgi:hypothetical protein